MPVKVNQGTQTPIATDSVGTTEMEFVKVNLGAAGVDGAIWDGNVGGTVAISSLPNITQGSIQVTEGTVVVSSLPNISQGSIQVTAGTISMINAGTLTSSGTTTGVGVVSMISAGTITNSGTTTGVGTVSNIGSIGNLGTIGGGTLGTVTGIGVVTTLTGGTVKLDGRAGRNILTYGTVFVGTAAAYGTLVGSASVGAGTSIWINDLSIVNGGTADADIAVCFNAATAGAGVLARGLFAPNSGIEKQFPLATNGGLTNNDLVFWLSGGTAGTAYINVSYFISV